MGGRGLRIFCTTPDRICTPRGGYGQHLRWLILLSEKYFDIETLNRPGYILDKTYFPKLSIDRKNWVLKHIYGDFRNFANYFDIERFLHIKIYSYFGFCHESDLLQSPKSDVTYKTVMGTIDTNLSVKHMFKINPFWLGNVNRKSSKEDYIAATLKHNENIINYVPQPNEKIFRYDANILHNPVLDKKFYDDLTNFLEIENVYDYAAELHTRWYDIHQQAEKDAFDFVLTHEYQDFPWTMFQLDFQKMGTKEQYNEIREEIIELYG